jgi:hypothetical protein
MKIIADILLSFWHVSLNNTSKVFTSIGRIYTMLPYICYVQKDIIIIILSIINILVIFFNYVQIIFRPII